jgi:acid phosphatase class B
MATRSFIAVKVKDGYNAIYCHWDGYIDGVGKNLYNNFKTLKEVNNLIGGGDVSSIDEKGIVSYYNDDASNTIFCSDYDELVENAKNCGAEYLYIFSGNTWNYVKLFSDYQKPEKLSEWFQVMESNRI